MSTADWFRVYKAEVRSPYAPVLDPPKERGKSRQERHAAQVLGIEEFKNAKRGGHGVRDTA